MARAASPSSPQPSASGSPVPPASSQRQVLVGLNVGGCSFLTTLATLSSRGPNFLSTMVENDISGRMASMKDPQGNYFIDRNGTLFSPVLEYLRTGHLTIPNGIPRSSVLRELDFYLITYRSSSDNVAPEGTPKPLARQLQARYAKRTLNKPIFTQVWPKIVPVLETAADDGLLELTISFAVNGLLAGASNSMTFHNGGFTLPCQVWPQDLQVLANWISETQELTARLQVSQHPTAGEHTLSLSWRPKQRQE